MSAATDSPSAPSSDRPADRPTGFPPRSARTHPRWVEVAFWGNLICQMGIIVSGGIVRVTGSGLGCDTWPRCTKGSFVPTVEQELGIHPYIEFGNRLLTFVLTAFAILVLVAAWRHLRQKGRGFLALSAAPLLGTGVQAVVGGVLVLVDLHPNLLIFHYLLSTALIAVSAVLLDRLHQGDEAPRPLVPVAVRRLWGATALVGLAVIVLGTLVTGSGPHSGDEDITTRLPFDTLLISRTHAVIVWVFVVLAIVLAVLLLRSRGAARPARRAVVLLLAVTALQGLIGYVAYFTGLPLVAVILHMVGSALFTWAIVHVGPTLGDRGDFAAPRRTVAPERRADGHRTA